MIVKLNIDYAKIDTEARQYVEYVGSKSAEGEYQRILLQVEDESLLDTLHGEMVATLNSVMMMWSIADKDTTADDKITGKEISYLLPSNAGISTPETVAKEANAFFVCYIVSRWMQIAGMPMAADKAEEASVHLKALCNAMTRRVPPLRQQTPHIPQHIGYVTNEDSGVCVTVEVDES